MFTGIIQTVGLVANIENKVGDISLTIKSSDFDLNSCELGDSIAVNGVCLTAVSFYSDHFITDVSKETLSKTNLGYLEVGSPINLEKALMLNTLLGGHLVKGHVDGLATLIAMEKDGRSTRYLFEVASELQRYIAVKGSVTLDGTSLTVNNVRDNQFDVNILPHTQKNTIFGSYNLSSRVNIEIDIIARYLERLINGKPITDSPDNQIIEGVKKTDFIQSI